MHFNALCGGGRRVMFVCGAVDGDTIARRRLTDHRLRQVPHIYIYYMCHTHKTRLLLLKKMSRNRYATWKISITRRKPSKHYCYHPVDCTNKMRRRWSSESFRKWKRLYCIAAFGTDNTAYGARVVEIFICGERGGCSVFDDQEIMFALTRFIYIIKIIRLKQKEPF